LDEDDASYDSEQDDKEEVKLEDLDDDDNMPRKKKRNDDEIDLEEDNEIEELNKELEDQ
jgi:hypothetical protein